jgi:DNA invertase Pin-like site-specific DNA recombinase
MTDADLLPPALLKRKAVVYVRQSTQAPVQLNLEGQRRQYELVNEARRRGFRDVEVIDGFGSFRKRNRGPLWFLRSS